MAEDVKKGTVVIPSDNEVLKVTETPDEIDITDVGYEESKRIVGDKATTEVMPM